MNKQQISSALTAGFLIALVAPSMALATSSTELVLESDVSRQAENTLPTKDWVVYTRGTTPSTAAAFRTGPTTPPLGTGSLELTTMDNDKVYAFNFEHIGTKLKDIDEISYSTFRSAGNAQQVAALNVVIDFNGPEVNDGSSTLVFEPVYNTQQGPVVSGEWQKWTGTGTGVWWSTKAINDQCAGATPTCEKTWAEIVASNPDATIMSGVGINQGTGNPGLKTAVDAFTFDEVTYNFEEVAPKPVRAASKAECKDGEWKNFQTDYKNQGDCVSDVASKGKAKGNPSVVESISTVVRGLFSK